MKKLIITIIAIILLANFVPPINYLFKEDYTYSNFDGSFRFNEEGGAGLNFNMAKRKYAWFLTEHPDKAKRDSQLYRTFTLKPWRFWQWSDYLFCPERFNLPYKPLSDLQP